MNDFLHAKSFFDEANSADQLDESAKQVLTFADATYDLEYFNYELERNILLAKIQTNSDGSALILFADPNTATIIIQAREVAGGNREISLNIGGYNYGTVEVRDDALVFDSHLQLVIKRQKEAAKPQIPQIINGVSSEINGVSGYLNNSQEKIITGWKEDEFTVFGEADDMLWSFYNRALSVIGDSALQNKSFIFRILNLNKFLKKIWEDERAIFFGDLRDFLENKYGKEDSASLYDEIYALLTSNKNSGEENCKIRYNFALVYQVIEAFLKFKSSRFKAKTDQLEAGEMAEIITASGLPENTIIDEPRIYPQTKSIKYPTPEMPRLGMPIANLYSNKFESGIKVENDFTELKLPNSRENLIRISCSGSYVLGFLMETASNFVFITYRGSFLKMPKSEDETYVFGRSFINNTRVSSRHFTLATKSGKIFIKDGEGEKKSTNGTFYDFVDFQISSHEDQLLESEKINAVQIKQGQIRNCTLLSSFTGILKHTYAKEILFSMVECDSSDLWTIRFPAFPNERIIVHSAEVSDKYNSKRAKSDSLIVRILEKAYAKLMVKFPQFFDAKLQGEIIPGGFYTKALDIGMGVETKPIQHLDNLLGGKTAIEERYKMCWQRSKSQIRELFELLDDYTRLAHKYILTCSASEKSPVVTITGEWVDIAPNHSYAIGEINEQFIEIINPWNTQKMSHKFHPSIFLVIFDRLEGVKITDETLEKWETFRIDSVISSFRNLAEKKGSKP
jgi:hypothetical protein